MAGIGVVPEAKAEPTALERRSAEQGVVSRVR